MPNKIFLNLNFYFNFNLTQADMLISSTWWRHKKEAFSPLLALLWWKSTGHWWIPLTKASDSELWCFPWTAPEQTVEQTIETPVIWNAIALIMTSLWCYKSQMHSYYLHGCAQLTAASRNKLYIDSNVSWITTISTCTCFPSSKTGQLYRIHLLLVH